MGTPQTNTKIELVVESIEDLAIAVSSRDHDAVLAARTLCADALREFLKPTLRVVSNVDPGERVRMIFGRGDALLKYPELVGGEYDYEAFAALCRVQELKPYVALHLTASEAKKIPPRTELLIDGLNQAHIPHVIVGDETRSDLPFNFRLHTQIVREASKFIGTLSVFNVIAQILKVPSFVLVNRSVKEPTIYSMMHANNANITPWNIGYPIELVYAEAIRWAQS